MSTDLGIAPYYAAAALLSLLCCTLNTEHTELSRVFKPAAVSRWFCLQVWQTEKQDFEDLADAEAHPTNPTAPHISHTEANKILWSNALQHFWPRLVATSAAWLSNDFA